MVNPTVIHESEAPANQTASYRYSVVIRFDPRDSIYIADVPELPGCRAHGDTYEEAVREVQDAMGAWLDASQCLGVGQPAPQYWQPRK